MKTLAIGVGAVVVVIGAMAWWSGARDDVVPASRSDGTQDVVLVEPGAAVETVAPIKALAPVEPAAERVVVPKRETPAGALYEVLDPNGRAVHGAELALCAEGDVLASGTTDQAGRFATELDRDGEAKLLVNVEGFAPQVHAVPVTAARHEVVLAEGEVVSGWVVVDGHAPDEPMPLELVTDRKYVDPPEDLGLDRETLVAAVSTRLGAMTRTGTSGSFRCAGLPAGWSGRIDLPSEYRIRDQIDAASDYRLSSVRLERAKEGVRIDVVRRAVLTGRVVDFPEGRAEPVPVAGVLVQPSLSYPEGTVGTAYQRWERTDEDGRFRVPLLALSVRGGYLTLEPPGREFWRSIAVEPLEFTGDHDLGDLALVDPEGRVAVPLLVQSTTGEPISGAVAGTDRESPISEPTGDDGRTSLRGVIPGASTIVVYAKGWEVTSADAPGEPVDELVVTMRRGASLELHFLQPNGEPAGGVRARLWSDVHPFRDEAPIALVEGYKSAGCSWYQTVRPADGTVVARIFAGRQGVAVASDVRPGVALHLRVEGQFGATVLETDLAPLAPEEWKVVDVELPRGPLTLHGRVVNEARAPLPSASYSISFVPPDSPPGRSMGLSSDVDENGAFEVPDIFQPRIHLSIDAPGYVEFRDREFEVPLDEEPVEFVLTEGRIVTVVLQDEEGHPMESSHVFSSLPGGGYSFGRAVVDEPGKYLLRGLPAEEVEIQAMVHDVVYKKTHDTLIPTLTFTIPTYEDVTVTLVTSGAVALDADCYVRLLPLDGANPYTRHRPLASGFSGPFEIDSVAPGRYEAVVSRYVQGDDEAAQFEDISARVSFTVAPDGPTSVTVEL